mgnify:FL=1
MGGKYHEKEDCFIGYVERQTSLIRKGLILRKTILKAIEKKFGLIKNIAPAIHAAVIFLLLKDHALTCAEKIVLCEDYHFSKVHAGLSVLLSSNEDVLMKFESLFDYRARCGENIGSYADTFVSTAYKHRKKAKNIHRRHEVFDNFHYLKHQDIIHCLEVILSNNPPVQITKSKMTFRDQKYLNTSQLYVYQ